MLPVLDNITVPEKLNAPLEIQVVDLTEVLNNPISPVRSEWLGLFQENDRAYIFHHPDYTLCELSFLPRTKLPCLLILCRRDGKLVGLGGMLPKLSSMRSVGGVGPNCNLLGYRLVGNGFLCSQQEVQSLLLESAMREVVSRGARYLLIEDVEQNTELFTIANQYTEKGCRIYSPTDIQVRLKIGLPKSAEEYFSKFSSKTRQVFRRKDKKLGNIRLVRCSSLEQIPEFLRDAHLVSLNTWQTEQFGLRVRNDAAELAQFTFLASHGALRSYLLYRDDAPLAFLIGNQYRGLFRYEEVGFDRRFHENSPGQTLLRRVLEEVFTNDTPQIFDFGMGDADYKRMFANIETKAGNLWIVPPGFRGGCLVNFLQISRTIRKTGRTLIQRMGWYQKLRQRLRLGGSVKPESRKSTEPQSDEQPIV